METIEETMRKFKEIFEKARLSTVLNIKSVLIVLDENEEREKFLFELVSLLHDKTGADFTFLLAARGYQSQAIEVGVKLPTLSGLVDKLKTKFSNYDELFEVAFIPTTEEKTPFERISELVARRKVDLVIIPVPFTLFAAEESETEDSLGITANKAISETLVNRIPIMLVRSTTKLPFADISVLLRRTTIRNDLIGWLVSFSEENATINFYYSSRLSHEEIEKVKLYHQVLNIWSKENKKLKIIFKDEPVLLNEFCEKVCSQQEVLVVFQSTQNVVDDVKDIISSLSFQRENVLIFPPIE
ncbi:MAG: hypothetical protein ACFFD4_39060 [Candidatus Odinarchaeota archaeon]